MEKIIENGINSIRVGIEDYKQGRDNDEDARLTSAVRNIFAGILILAKGKLYELSPEGSNGILIRNVKPKIVAGSLEWAPLGKSTISYHEIKERFEQLSLHLDWAKLDRVRSIRNELEHFYHSGTRVAVQEALVDAMMVIHSLLELLNLDPIRDLGEGSWKVLLKNNGLYTQELEKCRDTLSIVCWINQTAKAASNHFNCEECSSSLIRQASLVNDKQEDMSVICIACGAESEMKSLMERAVIQLYYGELYETQTRGGEPPIMNCTKCGLFTFVLEANECAACDNKQ